MNSAVKKALIVLAWLLIWQLASLALSNSLLLVGPIEVLVRLATDVTTSAFWASIAFSFVRILVGFVIAFCLALLLGTLAARFSPIRDFLAPAVSFIKSVPVVCIIVLMLVWMGASYVSIVAVALMVFPPVYFNYLEGMLQADGEMVRMLQAYQVGTWKRIRYYYWPTVLPYVISASRVVVGVSWKAGIAAEVIGIPNGSIGAGIYLSKLGLDTAGLFSWTLVIVLLSILCEKAFLCLLGLTLTWSSHVGSGAPLTEQASPAAGIDFEGAFFGYAEGQNVLKAFSYDFKPSGRYCLMAPSGSGKSTLLLLAAGLAKPRKGDARTPSRVSMVFQNDLLLPQLTAWDNVRLMSALPAADLDKLKVDLDEILGQDSSNLPVSSCSGGMKRKVALMRALAAQGDALLLDEPFAGLDDASKADAVALINRYLRGRTLLVATHDRDDTALLEATLVHL